MSFLYITEQGAVLRKCGQRYVIEKAGTTILDIQDFKLDAILIFGNISLTTPALSELLRDGIEVAFLTRSGRLKGQLTPIKAKNIPLRMKQYELYHIPEFRLGLAKAILRSKISNQLILIRRFAYNHPEVDIGQESHELERCVLRLERQANISTLLGLEGQAARAFFAAYSKALLKRMEFPGRRRRPPTDPVNSLLSFGYTLVLNEISSLLDGMGFDPYIGFLHGISYGRPSLALDLLEEFRSPVVDRLTLTLVNKGILRTEDFSKDIQSGGLYLKRDGMRTYFEYYEKFLNQEFSHYQTDESVTFRKCFRIQAEKLAKAITKRAEYQPFRWR